jgi:hypothetical protein
VTEGRTKTLHRGALAIALAFLLAGAAGCGEKASVTLHEPGVYKGDTDPLLKAESDPEHQAALRERFMRGQTDR